MLIVVNEGLLRSRVFADDVGGPQSVLTGVLEERGDAETHKEDPVCQARQRPESDAASREVPGVQVILGSHRTAWH